MDESLHDLRHWRARVPAAAGAVLFAIWAHLEPMAPPAGTAEWFVEILGAAALGALVFGIVPFVRNRLRGV